MLLCIPLSGVFFLVVCLLSASTVKRAALYLTILTLTLAFLCFSTLRDRVTLPLLALALYVLMDGVSTLYAEAGKFALYEFLKVLCAFCLALIFLAVAPGRGVESVRWIASILEGCVALSALVSIDMISTHLISDPVLVFLSGMTPDYLGLDTLIPGVRMTSIFAIPNAFAGFAGIGVILSLGLAISATWKVERAIHTSCLVVISLAFVLVFSMGGCGTIAVAFLVYLALENRERRSHLFLLMVETLAVTLISAMTISATSFDAWEAPRPIPLACIALSAVILSIFEVWINPKLSEKLRGHGQIAAVFLGCVVVLIAVYAILAFNLTGPIHLEPSDYLYRSIYPDPGEYTLDIQVDGPVNIRIISYSKVDILLRTPVIPYTGLADGATFFVPEESKVVYLEITSEQPVNIEKVSCLGVGEKIEVPLHYKILPGFVANRFQGLFANHSVMERLVFFEDGLKLFWRSPFVGHGLGGFENGMRSVQPYYYETKYAHSHYIQALVDTGVIGLLLFVGVIVFSGIAILRAHKKKGFHSMVPALGGALAFMAAHGGAEFDFSIYFYLPVAFVTFVLIGLCCQETLPRFKKEQAVQTWVVVGISALLTVFGFLLTGNLKAAALTSQEPTRGDWVEAIKLDRFEWTDYMLSYIISSMADGVEEDVRVQADKYAYRLSQVSSSTIPIYLAEYYLYLGRTELGLEMAEKYTAYTASDSRTWQAAFDLLERYEEGTETFRSGLQRLVERMDAWNEENLGTVRVSEGSMAFIERICS